MARKNSTRSAREHLAAWATILGLLPIAAAWAFQPAPPATGERAVSADAAPCLNVRARPSYRSDVVDCIDVGRRVNVTQVQGGWSQVVYGEGASGWVGGRFLVDASADPAPAEGASVPATQAPVTPEMAPAGSDPRVESFEAELARVALLQMEVERLSGIAVERDQLAERLRAAEELASTREVELSATRSAWEASAAEVAALTARVDELVAERDDLARRLARTEARLLYLRADLEKTRAELMQLKGVPQQLLAPEPALPPVALPAEPEPEPGTELELPAVTTLGNLDELVATVRAWAQAWSEQRADDYLSFYSPGFLPADGQSREVWAANRRLRITGPASIDVAIDQIAPTVEGDRATVTFVQSYTSDRFSDVVSKTLLLERSAVTGTWQIVDERAEPIAVLSGPSAPGDRVER